MISASELNDIATEAKNRLDEENAKVELEKLDVVFREKAAGGENGTYVKYLSQNTISRLRQLGYKVEYDDDYYISWLK
jgi:hypothetical protein